jgi:hypothetical protein
LTAPQEGLSSVISGFKDWEGIDLGSPEGFM